MTERKPPKLPVPQRREQPGNITILVPKREWIRRISESWRKAQDAMLAGILQCGRDLLQAKRELGHGEFIAMIERELPFGRRTAHMMMAIVRDPRVSNGKHVSHLPPSWGTLYQITRLNDETFERLLDQGVIRPDLERGEIARIVRRQRVLEDEQRVLNLRPIVGKFRTIVLDPAWEYDWLSIAGRAKPGYAMQSIEQLEALDVKAWADETAGCQLYCWATDNFMYVAGKLIERWGFQHRQVLTWIKPPPFGLGSYYRNSTEHVIFATRGKTTTRPIAAKISTHFEAPRGEHSEKPERFYEIVRAGSYPPYGEGNQRRPRPDFTNLYCPITEPDEEDHA